ncbi:hypothetical protein vBEcoPHC25922_2 [Escherichia phage vB_EcoP_HC-25922]
MTEEDYGSFTEEDYEVEWRHAHGYEVAFMGMPLHQRT